MESPQLTVHSSPSMNRSTPVLEFGLPTADC